jgi:hypothetical protein
MYARERKKQKILPGVFQSFVSLFEVRGIRDKRHEELKIGV